MVLSGACASSASSFMSSKRSWLSMKLLFKQSKPSKEELSDREELLEEERDSLAAMERAEEEAGAGATGVVAVVRLLRKRPETVAEF